MQENDFSFNKLTPDVFDHPSYNAYASKLDKAYADPDVKNIAITGIYGSGKSSVWRTYRRKNKVKEWKECQVIEVALSHFENPLIKNPKPSDEEEFSTDSVERQIINQIIYQIDPKEVTSSKYPVKEAKSHKDKRLTNLKIFLFLIGLTSLVMRSPLLGFFPEICKWVDMLFLGLGVILVAGSIYQGLVWFFSRHNSLKFTRLNFKGAEAQIGEVDDGSVLNQEIRELVYLITSADVHTIVFEDLDRFENVELFTKLRELNYLVNAKLMVDARPARTKEKDFNSEDKRVVRFVYIIKDDLFLSKERTKFFDYILPIVPVLDTQNSRAKMIEYFSDITDEFVRPEKKILERIALFVDDMRLLRSVRNEYEVYRSAIDAEGRALEANKLLAIIVFKNIFPQEFCKLQRGRGYIYGLFAKKEDSIKNFSSRLERKIETKLDHIERLKSTAIKQRADLVALNLPTTLSQHKKKITWAQLLNEMHRNPEDKFAFQNAPYSSTSYNYQELERMASEQEEYKEMEEYIGEGLISNQIHDLEKEISDQKGIIHADSILKLSDYLNHKLKEGEEIDNFFIDKKQPDPITENHYFPLIRFLLIEGLLDETYPYYLGFFYPGSMGIEDEKFLRTLFAGSALGGNFALDNPEIVVEELLLEDFDRKGAYNIDIIKQLISEKKNSFLERLVKNVMKTKNADSLVSYLGSLDYEEINKFVLTMPSDDLTVMLAIINHNLTSKKMKYKYIVALISNYENLPDDIDELERLTSKHSLLLEEDYVSNNSLFFDGLIENEVKFKNLTDVMMPIQVATKIEKNSLFELSVANVLQLVSCIMKDDYVEYSKHLLDIVSQTEFEVTSEAVQESLDVFLQDYNEFLQKRKITAKHSVATIISVINSEIETSIKRNFLELNDTLISDIEDVKDTNLWDAVIESDRLTFSESNVENYWDKTKKTEILIPYLNNMFDSDKECSFPQDLADQLINSNVSEVVFDQALKQANSKIISINADIPEIELRLDKILERDLLELTKDNLDIVRELNAELIIKFASNHDSYFVSFIDDNSLIDSLDSKIITELLNKRVFEEEASIQLLMLYKESISLFDILHASKSVREFVIENNFDTEDLNYIIRDPSNFDLWDKFTSEVFSRMNSSTDISNQLIELEWNQEFVDEFLSSVMENIEHATWILSNTINKKCCLGEIPIWLEKTPGLEKIVTLFQGRKPSISSEHEKDIAEALESIGVISISQNEKGSYVNFRSTIYSSLIDS